jgi:sugar (pentulose or hexulose) kinase
LRDRGNPAYLQLERWVQMVAADSTATVVAPPTVEPAPVGASGFAGARAEEKPASPADPFDPGEFNKKVRPPKP